MSHCKTDLFNAFPDTKTGMPDRPPLHGHARSRLGHMSGDYGRRGNNPTSGFSGDYGAVAADANAATPKASHGTAHGGKKIAGKQGAGREERRGRRLPLIV